MLFKFVSGNKLSQALIVSEKYSKNNIVPIINYVRENSNKDKVYDTIYKYDKLIDNINSNYIIALKLSSLNFNNKFINYLINKCMTKNIKCIIDAEDNYNINNYRNIVNKLLYRYNKNKITVIKTYQMYRKDSLSELKEDLFNYKNINLSTKIVRGAYHNKEYYEGHLYTNKLDTDNNYNNAIRELCRENTKFNIIATHNVKSIELLKKITKHTDNNRFMVANLMGMNENYMNKLIYNKGIYIPYGPYINMIPYLLRRLYENIDQIKYTWK